MSTGSTITGLPPHHYKTVRNLKTGHLFAAFMALTSGGLVYILFRPAEPVFFRWIYSLGLLNAMENIRSYSLAWAGTLPDWFVFSLPNGLWAYAYTLCILSIWSGARSWLRIIFYAAIPIVAGGYEFLQLAGVAGGMFCYTDLAFSLTGIILGIISIKLTTNIHRYEIQTY